MDNIFTNRIEAISDSLTSTFSDYLSQFEIVPNASCNFVLTSHFFKKLAGHIFMVDWFSVDWKEALHAVIQII